MNESGQPATETPASNSYTMSRDTTPLGEAQLDHLHDLQPNSTGLVGDRIQKARRLESTLAAVT
jgi:hypothetical protein